MRDHLTGVPGDILPHSESLTKRPLHPDRERSVAEAFVSLTTSLIEGHEVVDLYGRLTQDCLQILDICAAGLLIADPFGALRAVAVASDRPEDLALFMLQTDEGPCLEAFSRNQSVIVHHIRDAATPWPTFAAKAAEAGVRSVHAAPLRRAGGALGVLGLFRSAEGPLIAADLELARAFARTAVAAMVAAQAAANVKSLTDQLQNALNDSVMIEQAKGMLAYAAGISAPDASTALQHYSGIHGITVRDTAHALLGNLIEPAAIIHRAQGRETRSAIG